MTQNSPPISGLSVRQLESDDIGLAQRIGKLFDALATDEFYPSLIAMLKSVVPFDDAYVMSFRHGMKPACPYRKLSALAANIDTAVDKDSKFSDNFVHDMYIRSPFYTYCMDGGDGFKILSEVAPSDFEDSLYYHDYMLPAQLKDDAAYSIHGDGGSDFLIFLGRSNDMPLYTEAEAQQFRELAPIVERAVLNHDHFLTQLATDVIEYVTSTGMLETKLDFATSEALTERERQIVGYLIRGFSSKACARELDISPSTERVHRKNIYQKLHVSSQSELLAAVFDALFS